MTELIIGVLFAIGFIWPIQKLSPSIRRKLNGYAFTVDILVGSLMAFIFFGTQGGMIIAVIATVMFTGYMSWSALTIGSEQLTWKGWRRIDE
jgi:hypothetical protein